MKTLKKDLSIKKACGSLTQVEEYYLQEVHYAMRKLNKREMFTTTNEVVQMMHLQQQEQEQDKLDRNVSMSPSKSLNHLQVRNALDRKNRLSMRL